VNDRSIADALAALNADQIVGFRADATELSRSLHEVPPLATAFCALSEVGYDEALTGFTQAVTNCNPEERQFILALARRAVRHTQAEDPRNLWRAIRATVLALIRQDRPGR